MTKLIDHLKSELTKIPGVTIGPYKDTALICVFYQGKEFAHFHNNHEIDVRMPAKFVRLKELGEPTPCAKHPNRSTKSIWRCVRFETRAETQALVNLLRELVEYGKQH